LKKHCQQSLERQIVADLSQSSQTVALAQSGMRIMSMHVLQGVSTEDGGEAVPFRNLLPIRLSDSRSEEYLLRGQGQPKSDDWRYQPSETIVELVRKRLEQIDAGEEADEDDKTEAAEVSAGRN
jgi:hypothetical protein